MRSSATINTSRGARRSPQQGRRTGARRAARGSQQNRRRRGRARAQPQHGRKDVRHRVFRSRRNESPERTSKPESSSRRRFPPRPLGRGLVLFDEDELGTGRERLPHSHARLDPLRLGPGGRRANSGSSPSAGASAARTEQARAVREVQRVAQSRGSGRRRPSNVCSTRTRVRCRLALGARRNGLRSRRNLGRRLDQIAEREAPGSAT